MTTLSTARRLASLLAGLALEVLAGLALALGALRLLLALLEPAPAPVPALVPALAPVPTPPAPLDPAGELARLAGFRVVELRARARHRLGADARVNGRRIAQARKADLLTALAAA
jgi:hypothetical protein